MWLTTLLALLAVGSLALLTASHPARARDILTDAAGYTTLLTLLGYLLTR